MTEREKLIRLIIASVDGCAEYWAARIADHLLANGVKLPVTCGECKIKERCRTTNIWANAPSDDWFCADGKRRAENG